MPDALVSGLRDTLVRLRADRSPLADRLSIVDGDEEILRRLRAHHLAESLDESLEAAYEMVGEELERARPTPETVALLQAVFERSGPEQVAAVLGRLPEPLGGDDAAPERARIWAWLQPLSEPPEPWLSTRRVLEAEYGDGTADLPFGRRGAFIPSRSPRDASDLVDLGPVASLQFALDWRGEDDRWGEPSAEGLARELSSAATSDAEAWVEALAEVAEGLPPRYVAAILDGVSAAFRDGSISAPPWHSVVAIGVQVARHLGSVADDSGATWEWAASSVVRLLLVGFDKDVVPIELLDTTADVLRQYMRHRQPETVGSSDALTIAINKLSTRALEALLGVALTAHRLKADRTRRVAELFDAIDEELSVVSEHRFAVAICGRWLHVLLFLDRDATEARLPVLFGDLAVGEVDVTSVRDCLPWIQKNRETLVSLVPYARALLDVVDDDDTNQEEMRAAVDYLILCYDAELPVAWDPETVLGSLRLMGRLSRGAEMYGRILLEVKDLAEERANRALAYWDTALARDDPAPAFQGFGWWAESELSDEDWIRRLSETVARSDGRLDWDHEVVARLCRLPEKVETWRILAAMVRSAREYWTLLGWTESLRALLQATERPWVGDEVGRRDLVEALLEREMFEFRGFLR